jgi:hypothetical protein
MSTELKSAPTAAPATGVRRFRFDAPPIDSIVQMEEIARDPEKKGKTFHVTKEVFEHFRQRLHLLPGPPDDISRINRLLGTNFPENETMGMTGFQICPHCGHKLSFADHIEAVLRMGLHTPEDIRQLFLGHQYFLTVATHEKRAMMCPNCTIVSDISRDCYSTQTYAYAVPLPPDTPSEFEIP